MVKKATKKKTAKKGGRTFNFGGCDTTLEDVYGDEDITQGELLKGIWAFIKSDAGEGISSTPVKVVSPIDTFHNYYVDTPTEDLSYKQYAKFAKAAGADDVDLKYAKKAFKLDDGEEIIEALDKPHVKLVKSLMKTE